MAVEKHHPVLMLFIHVPAVLCFHANILIGSQLSNSRICIVHECVGYVKLLVITRNLKLSILLT